MITYEEVLDELQGIVSTNPDYVYQPPTVNGPCKYFADGKPSCLVGHWLDWRGIELPLDAEGSGASQLFRRHRRYDFEAGTSEQRDASVDIEIDQLAVNLLDVVQCHQDEKIPWGIALSLATGHADDYDYEEAIA